MQCIKLGIAPTRRDMFSRQEAIRIKNVILDRVRGIGVEFLDLDWLNEDGLLYNAGFVDAVENRFREEGVDALFLPHCNFGNEEAVCKLASRLRVPTLLWGPRDDAPQPDGSRLRDSQCGMFATSRVLRRMGVPFTYLENTWVDGPEWLEGLERFLRTAAVVKAFGRMRIGQIDTRPGDFWSVMCNESELLEKFHIEVAPLTLVDVIGRVRHHLENGRAELEPVVAMLKQKYVFDCDDEAVNKMAALRKTLADWAEEAGLSAIAVQCWNALQDELGIAPCLVNALLTDEGLPVVCETDILGAATAVLTQAAAGGAPIFFADVTVRHPTNDNAELLWHCGSFPASLCREGETATVGRHYTLASGCPGVCEWELKPGEVTVVRFDGAAGIYSLLAAAGHTVQGPRSRGTYLWVEFPDWPALERKLIEGPYIHHVAGAYGDLRPVLREALRYLPAVNDDIMTE